ncbi:MAG: hypothetical protein ABGW87_04035 [Sphingomonadaceae bacterium]
MSMGQHQNQSGIGREIDLRTEQLLAVNLAKPDDRPIFETFFALDNRLAEISTRTSEPMFAQMRLAWWRDSFAGGDKAEAKDPLQQTLRECYGTRLMEFTSLVNGWEALLVGDSADAERVEEFVRGYADSFGLIADLTGLGAFGRQARRAGELWALSHAARSEVRDAALARVRDGSELRSPFLPKRLRPLAMLGVLSARALRKGGVDLIGDRLSPLVALRIGLIGR